MSEAGGGQTPEPSQSSLLGRYEILGQVGSGAAGTVYRARDPLLGREVAIKAVHTHLPDDVRAEYLDRYRIEARVVGGLSHPNIVRVYDAGTDADRPYLVMELCSGPTLQALVRHAGALAPEEAHWLLLQILQGLHHVHRQGVVHRDLKASNVLLHGYGVKLADFGIARTAEGNNTLHGTLIGTPFYMSPEQVRGEVADHRADLWAMGVMTYSLLTGAYPFEGPALGVLHKVCSDEPARVGDKIPELEGIYDDFFKRALNKDKDARFQSAREMFEGLTAIVPVPHLRPPAAIAELGFAEGLEVGEPGAASLFSWGSTGSAGISGSILGAPIGATISSPPVSLTGGTPRSSAPPQGDASPSPRPRWRVPAAAGALLLLTLGTLGVWRLSGPAAPVETASGLSDASGRHPPEGSGAPGVAPGPRPAQAPADPAVVVAAPAAAPDAAPDAEVAPDLIASAPGVSAAPPAGSASEGSGAANAATASAAPPARPSDPPPSAAAPQAQPPPAQAARPSAAPAAAPSRPAAAKDPGPEAAPGDAPPPRAQDAPKTAPAAADAPAAAPKAADAPKEGAQAVAALPPPPTLRAEHTPPGDAVAGEPLKVMALVPEAPEGSQISLRWEQGGKSGRVAMAAQRRGRQVVEITPAEGPLTYRFEARLPDGREIPIGGPYTLTPAPPKPAMPPMGF